MTSQIFFSYYIANFEVFLWVKKSSTNFLFPKSDDCYKIFFKRLGHLSILYLNFTITILLKEVELFKRNKKDQGQRKSSLYFPPTFLLCQTHLQLHKYFLHSIRSVLQYEYSVLKNNTFYGSISIAGCLKGYIQSSFCFFLLLHISPIEIALFL